MSIESSMRWRRALRCGRSRTENNCLLLRRTDTQDGITPRKGRGLAARIYGRRRSREICSSPASASFLWIPPTSRTVAPLRTRISTSRLSTSPPPPPGAWRALTAHAGSSLAPPLHHGLPSAGAFSLCGLALGLRVFHVFTCARRRRAERVRSSL